MVAHIALFSLLLCGELLNHGNWTLTNQPVAHLAAITATMPATQQSQNRNSIRGRITDTSGRPLDRVRVELQNEVEMYIKQVYTDGIGRYDFTGLSLGTFIVKVHSNGTHIGRSARIQLTPARLSGGTSHQELLDFVLYSVQEVKNPGVAGNTGVVFAQEVPENARKQYEKAVKLLEQNKTEDGVEALKETLKLFTNYFMAWERLGLEYVKLEHYEAAHLALTQAIKANPNAANSLYALGYAQYQLSQWNNASKSFEKSLRLAPDSPNAAFAHFYFGLALLKDNKANDAESHLKQAYVLGHNSIPVEVHLRLAQIYSDNKRYKEAADELEVYLKRAPRAQDANSIKDLVRQLRTKATGAPTSKLLSSTH